MIVEYSNLDDRRKIFINKELADILYLCRKRKIPIPEINFNIVSLSADFEIPPTIRNRINIETPEKEKEFRSFNDLCEWEKNIQTSQVIVDEDKIWIIGGGSEGAIYGFYETIKKITGIRWYSTSESDIIFVEPSKDIEKVYRPLVALRGFEFSPKNENIEFSKKFLKWMVRNRWNLLDINAAHWENFQEQKEFISLCETYGIRIAIGCHAIDFFLPESLFLQHPEFFGLRDNKRCLSAEICAPDIARKWKGKIQPCYSNQELKKILVQTINDFIKKHPETYIFSLWPLDGINNWCQCDECKQKTPYEIFYNLAMEISNYACKFLPIELLCYSNMLHLPEKTLPFSSNTYTIFCPYLRHYKHRFYEPGFDESKLTLGKNYPEPEPINPLDDREYGILLSKWLPYLKEIGSQLGLFSYYQLVFHDETERTDRSRYLYLPEPELVEDEIKKFIENGIKVFYDCSPPYPGFWPDSRFYAYLPQLFWQENQDADKSVREYYKAIAGERAQVLFNILKKISNFLENRTNSEIPEEILKTAKAIFCLLPEPLSLRYSLWLDYIQMGNKSWNELKNGNIKNMIETEEQIMKFFEINRCFLQDYINVDYMIGYSRSVINFYKRGETI